MNTRLRRSSSRLSALLRLGALAAAAFAFSAVGAQAQQGPLTTSPTAPTPFSWGTFHSGGTSPTPLPATPLSFLPPNPLAPQLQGTPTGVNGTGLTEIPSFLIGNYDYSVATAANFGGIDSTTTPPSIYFFPNHFADDTQTYLSWSAPFTFLASPGTTTTMVASQGDSSIEADDSQTTAYTYPVYIAGTTGPPPTSPTPASGVDAGWTVSWAASTGWTPQLADGTASGNPMNLGAGPYEYVRQAAVAAPIGTKSSAAAGYATATWTFTAPTTFALPAAAGLYSVVFHLPDPQGPTSDADGTTANPNYPEHRIGDAHYVIKVNGTVVYDTDELDKNLNIVSRTAISQTETNDPQPLAGPFALAAGDVLTVTLDNTTTQTIANPASTYVIADSVSLVPTASAGGSARMDGSPVAVSVGDFPEIANALYYGFAVTRNAVTGVVTQADDIFVPYGNAVVGTTATGTGTTAPTSAQQHNIRQLVYFGRYEGIVLTDAAGNLIDNNGAASTTPFTRMVGAIYCVDGITGSVVWRFQTPDVLASDGVTVLKPSAPVYTTPAVARLNVLVNGILETKLCVVAADDNGLVYCLDAIGNRNGTSNGSVTATAYNQPVYDPAAAPVGNSPTAPDLGTGNHAHVGNTNAYWVYRPDATRPISQTTPLAIKTIDPASDLPVPAAFGLASPTIYVNPYAPTQAGTLLPGGTPTGPDPATVVSNGTVYIGNSNGTLYSLNASGTPVTETAPPTTTLPNGSGVFYSSDNFNYVLPISQTGYQTPPTAPAAHPDPLPSPAANWWFAVNKAATTDTTQTANVAITSAPSIYQPQPYPAPGPTAPLYTPPDYNIYFSTGNETTNVGNVFAVSNRGLAVGTGLPGSLVPGSTDYNTLERPFWSFPNAYANTGDKKIHAALGSISGSPVVFTNPDDSTTRIYFAANMGPEGYQSERPVPAENGRIWAVDFNTGLAQWAYPNTVDPNADDTLATGDRLLGTGTTLTADQIAALPSLGTFRNSSPAIGSVQFPAVINFGPAGTTAYSHADNVRADVRAAVVPMLYIGAHTGAPDSSNFFALDLDGNTDNLRNIFYDNKVNASSTAPVGLTYGPGFEASPLLVTNPGPLAGAGGTAGVLGTGGNGGVVFAVGIDGTLSEFTATPLTDIGDDSTGPQFTNFFPLGGFGPFASPAIAGFSATDLAVSNVGATTTFTQFDTDWVYGGDGILGVARGITPGTLNNGSTGTTADYGNAGTGPDSLRPPVVPQQLPLHVYLFDNKGTPLHDPKSTDMSKANTVGGPVASFEWGEKLYIRVSNVVPPNPTGIAAKYMADPGDPTIYYTNGGSIRVQLSDIDATGKVVTGRGADIATININTLTDLSNPDSNGFVPESAPGKYDDGTYGDVLKDNNGAGSIWLGATTYDIGNGSNRKNTPGSRRQIISATQNVEAHAGPGYPGHQPGDFLQNVILQVSVDSSPSSFRRGGKIVRLPKVDQPTFAVLNPLAVRGGGPNIPLGNNSVVAQINDVAGPFTGIDTTTPTVADLGAYVNGNDAYVSVADVPKSGVLGGDLGQKRLLQVITATTDIPHGSVGNNSNPNALPASPRSPSSTRGNALDATKYFGDYAFDVADRSALGLTGNQISKVTVQTAPAEWNDNTGSFAGPGAAVNPLPWDDQPTAYRAGTNGSVDYPNIGKQRLGHTLFSSAGSASVSDNGTALDAATAPSGATPSLAFSNRIIQPDDVEVEVRVPKYQPANLQLYEPANVSNPRIAPTGLTSGGQIVYPMGYVARETVYVDTNGNHRRDDGEAYRTFSVYTGVPVDMTMTVADPTIDLGKLPQTFGVQTDASALLGQFMPFQPVTLPIAPVTSPPGIAPAGIGYQRYFQPLTVYNNGNINLLNVHFDQKLLRYNAAAGGGTTPSALPFGSDALDAQNVLNAYDMNGVTGPASVAGTQKYILRTSLDSDLSNANRNPGIVTLNNTAYPDATFHKARVSDSTGPALTVPDVPHDNPFGGAYYLSPVNAVTTLVNGVTAPVTTGIPTIDFTTKRATSYGKPYIGLAVPLGTPVGAYAQDVRLFEGIDPTSLLYPAIQGTSNLYKPLFPPVYGGAVATFDGTAMPGLTTDTLTTVGSSVTQPYSNPTRVRASITETRVTDGNTYGNLPQVDSNPVNTVGAADFLPVAFRNTFWNGGAVSIGDNGLSLYWTSSAARPFVANGPPYTLIGAHAPFTVAADQGYFQATANGSWFGSLSPVAAAAPNSFNTAIGVAPDQHQLTSTNSNAKFSSDGTAYAFVQNVAVSGTAYQNNLYCYQVDAATGAVTGTGVPVSLDTQQPKFGARGLKFSTSTVTFHDALTPATPIGDNLWAFWNGGARGSSKLFFSSAPSASIAGYASGGPTPFTAAAQVLPTPAGLSAVADPSAIITQTNMSTGTVPALDVTYTGVNADGNTDVYVSRYLPYLVRKSDGTTIATDVNGKKIVGLALTPSPAITEQLLPDTSRQFYQARDVAWARADTIDVQVNSVSILQDTTKTQNADGSYPLYAGIKTNYDTASGTMVYTGIPNGTINPGNSFTPTGGGTISVTTIYADLVRGRVRFRTAYTTAVGTPPSRFDVPVPDGNAISATFQPQARRITIDSRADTEPISFIDEAYKPNEANFYNVSIRAAGTVPANADVARVSTARYWFIWRKSGAPGTTTTPTLYAKTQRLTVYLHGPAPSNSPVPIQLNASNQPIVTVIDTTTGTVLYSAGSPSAAQVDVDWARGRLYFPLRDSSGHALEGDKVSVTFTAHDGSANGVQGPQINATILWLDELRYNDPAAQPIGTAATTIDTNEHAVPIDVATNEGSPSAFLDPMAYADVAGGAYDPFSSTGGFTNATTTLPNPDQPHKVWLFWNSTRNGTADVYYEALDPRFSANP